MTLYDLAIAVRDEMDLPSGHKRKKEGDVIAIRPHSETVRLGGWGTSEVLNHLIVTIDLTDEEVTYLQHTHFDDGSFGEAQMMMPIHPSDKVWEPNKTYFNTNLDLGNGTTQSKVDSITESYKIFQLLSEGSGNSGNEKPDFASVPVEGTIQDGEIVWKCISDVQVKPNEPDIDYNEGDFIIEDDWMFRCTKSGRGHSNNKATLSKKFKDKITHGSAEFECVGNRRAGRAGKRRYNFPLENLKDGWHPDLDLDKVRNVNLKYQPFIDNNIVIDGSEHVSIIKDKHTNKFKYSKKKIHGQE